MPPSKAALYERLINRGTDTKVTIKQRINESERDMSHWSEFNYCIINDDLDYKVNQFTIEAPFIDYFIIAKS